jgi:hypothetical protein
MTFDARTESVFTREQLERVSTLRPSVARHRRIAILGFGKTVRDVPWRDPSWELWGMNGFWRAAKPDFGIDAPEDRYSLWLDMHTLEYTRDYGVRAKIGTQQLEWLRREHPFEILALEEFGPDYPSVRAYPLESVLAKHGRDYFTSTVAYAIALAASLDDVAEIGLWGIDLIHDTEYADQRPCAEYWAARAEGLGITVTPHADSAMLRQRWRYGYEPPEPLLGALRASLVAHGDRLNAAITRQREELDAATMQLHTDNGGLQAITQVIERLDAYARGGKL